MPDCPYRSRFVSGHAFRHAVKVSVRKRLQALRAGLEFHHGLLTWRGLTWGPASVNGRQGKFVFSPSPSEEKFAPENRCAPDCWRRREAWDCAFRMATSWW